MHNTTSLRRILISCIALLVFAAVYTPAQAHDFGGTTILVTRRIIGTVTVVPLPLDHRKQQEQVASR